jgi:hypothetical protein
MFDLKDLAGFSIEFKRDAYGNVREAPSTNRERHWC